MTRGNPDEEEEEVDSDTDDIDHIGKKRKPTPTTHLYTVKKHTCIHFKKCIYTI